MDTANLKEYLEIVVDMEKNIYLQERMISQMQNRSDQLGHAHEYPIPAKPSTGKRGWGILVIPCVVILIGFFLISWDFVPDYNHYLSNGISYTISYMGTIFFIVGVIIAIIMFSSKMSEGRAIASYNATYAEYSANVLADNERVNYELIEKEYLSSELNQLQKQNEDSKRNLEHIYSKNIIFPKYRNLVMVCSLYEYICSGRCTALEGHEGAYNILEMEIRLDRIIVQLDQVIADLDAIKTNQYMLYVVVQEINENVDRLCSSAKSAVDNLQGLHASVDQLKARITSAAQNSELTAYRAKTIQDELQYINRIDTL